MDNPGQVKDDAMRAKVGLGLEWPLVWEECYSWSNLECQPFLSVMKILFWNIIKSLMNLK